MVGMRSRVTYRHQKTEIFYPNLDNDDNANDCEGDAKYETSVNDYDK